MTSSSIAAIKIAVLNAREADRQAKEWKQEREKERSKPISARDPGYLVTCQMHVVELTSYSKGARGAIRCALAFIKGPG